MEGAPPSTSMNKELEIINEISNKLQSAAENVMSAIRSSPTSNPAPEPPLLTCLKTAHRLTTPASSSKRSYSSVTKPTTTELQKIEQRAEELANSVVHRILTRNEQDEHRLALQLLALHKKIHSTPENLAITKNFVQRHQPNLYNRPTVLHPIASTSSALSPAILTTSSSQPTAPAFTQPSNEPQPGPSQTPTSGSSPATAAQPSATQPDDNTAVLVSDVIATSSDIDSNSSDEEDFQTVNYKRARRDSPIFSPKTNTNNRFESLMDIEHQPPPSQTAVPANSKPSFKIPSIKLDPIPNWPQLIKKINEQTSLKPVANLIGQQTLIKCSTIAD